MDYRVWASQGCRGSTAPCGRLEAQGRRFPSPDSEPLERGKQCFDAVQGGRANLHIHTMGGKITKLTPMGGFAAETGAAVAIFTATHFGVGVSTTHTITGAIVGVGATRRLSAVRWGVARQIVWAWVLTIPAAAAIGALLYVLIALTGAR